MSFALGPRAVDSGYRLAAFDQLGSTNAEALSRAREGERGPMWFATTRQTAGRGRRQRAWIAPPGNLACSILEVVDVSPAIAATLGFVAGLALADALSGVSVEAAARTNGGLDFRLKWPNDVVVLEKKLAGILLEAEALPGDGLAVVVGIGTNVVSAPEGTPTSAVSLASLGISITAEELFSVLSDSWTKFRTVWDNGDGFAEIRKLWLSRAAGVGQAVAVKSGNSVIEGTFDTIDERGCMIVRTAQGERKPISAGDVYFGTAASAGAA
jgi:BirA family biotin operon repressor/biotin-[acetyl-CoA-carboxylase] ligase